MDDVFTHFCWGVQIHGRGSISTSGFGSGGPYPLADLDRGGPNIGGSNSAGTPAFNYVTCKNSFKTEPAIF